jgi:ABC-type uncharacterized transport system substrate-binding protein
MRRKFPVWQLATILLVTVSIAQAQQPARVPRIGILLPGIDGGPQSPSRAPFEAKLRKLGWASGQNLIIERRFAAGKLDRLPEMAAELIHLPVDAILASGPAIRVTQNATRTIPIIMTFGTDDPVEAGFIKSLAHPGSNITGVITLAPEVGGKRLELLKAAIPTITRVAVLTWPGRSSKSQMTAIEVAAQSLGVRLQVLEVPDATGYEGAFQNMSKGGSRTLLVLSSSVYFGDRRRIIELAMKHRVSLMAPFREYAEDGGLMAYGPNIPELWGERVPLYVDKILKGAKPADLPVEQPTRFEFVINLKAAKQIGITIPPNVLARADKVLR